MMKRLLMMVLIVMTVSLGASILSPLRVNAACGDPFLTFRPWYHGLISDMTTCKLMTPGVEGEGDIELTAFVWTVILNILSILFNLVGYLALGFIIYGGYLYVLSRGDQTRIARGKNTVVRAVIGLIICILASLIANTIVNIITGATTA
jgi:hypothetical protein